MYCIVPLFYSINQQIIVFFLVSVLRMGISFGPQVRARSNPMIPRQQKKIRSSRSAASLFSLLKFIPMLAERERRVMVACHYI
jgi:hypothetical protein